MWPCDSYGDLIAKYYRDTWAERCSSTKCTPLAGMTLAKAPVVEWPYVFWPKFTFNAFAGVPRWSAERWTVSSSMRVLSEEGECQECAQTGSGDQHPAANANQVPIENGPEIVNFRPVLDSWQP